MPSTSKRQSAIAPRLLPPAWPVREPPPQVVLPANRLRRCPDCREPFRPATPQDRQCGDCRRKLEPVVAPRRPRRLRLSRLALLVSACIVVSASAVSWFATRGRPPRPAPLTDARMAPADSLSADAAVEDGFHFGASAASLPRVMHVQSDPPGAAVWHAGEPLGYTPLELSLPLTRSTDSGLLLIKDGFQPQRLPLSAAADGAALSATLLALRGPGRNSAQDSEQVLTADNADHAKAVSQLHAEPAAPANEFHSNELTEPTAEMVAWRTLRPSRDRQTHPGELEPLIESGGRELPPPGQVGPAIASAGPLSAGQFVAIAVGRVADPADLAAARERARQAVDSLRDDQSLCVLIESPLGLIDVFGRYAPADPLRRIRARDAIDSFACAVERDAARPDVAAAPGAAVHAGAPLDSPWIDLPQLREADTIWLLCADARHRRPWPAPATTARRTPRIIVECVHSDSVALETEDPNSP